MATAKETQWLKEIRSEYDRLDAICGVDTKGIKLTVSTRAKKHLGCCKSSTQIGPFEISFSSILFNGSHDDILSVARHEYAHALVGIRYPYSNHGHDAVWKNACIEIGCDPSRIFQGEKNIYASMIQASSKYIVECQSCNHRWYYQRKGKIIESIIGKQRRRGGFPTCPLCHSTAFRVYEKQK